MPSKGTRVRFFIVSFLYLITHQVSFSQTDSCSFFGNRPIYPYYTLDLSNGKDFYTVKKDFHKTITAKTNFNGIIAINFYINDKGDTDFYNTQICDADYKPLSITSDIEILCSQILTAVKQTAPWKPAFDNKKNVINSRKFYSFRFNNGTLVEILPK